ncbi:hypothetical protein KJZ24_04460 [Enterococcus faecalis]|uniref:hypothetical protein n=1 Tax=Enterococcus faecalis TaxID=1351 RepID=UPI00032DF189|nr:hypothetical protein [Enterococcus faecalis]EKO5884840.1 hypothetical protein [Enterococcus faecalis]EOK04339.1 hypothetical protein WOS_02288 [Enterococcus faecalis EnGen0367]MBJ1692924.1 hypothetical protein [Enterococcus faecalis]MCE2533294.1 hypothetical protein [Enterococcus faecalis]MCE2554544.1 hypothetical protein [Enterococcus faecalis]
MKKLLQNKQNLITLGIIVAIVIGTILFFSNKGVVTKQDWDSLQIGMSIKKVEEQIGKPKKVETDLSNISDNLYSEYEKMYDLNSIVSDNSLEKRMERLNDISNAVDADKNVKEYTYIEKGPSGKRNVQVYFVNGAARYFNREKQ